MPPPSLPALTITSAIDSTNKVVEAAGEIQQFEQEEFIANFLGGILFFVPFVGEALEASLVAICTALTFAEISGEAGLLAYSGRRSLGCFLGCVQHAGGCSLEL